MNLKCIFFAIIFAVLFYTRAAHFTLFAYSAFFLEIVRAIRCRTETNNYRFQRSDVAQSITTGIARLALRIHGGQVTPNRLPGCRNITARCTCTRRSMANSPGTRLSAKLQHAILRGTCPPHVTTIRIGSLRNNSVDYLRSERSWGAIGFFFTTVGRFDFFYFQIFPTLFYVSQSSWFFSRPFHSGFPYLFAFFIYLFFLLKIRFYHLRLFTVCALYKI